MINNPGPPLFSVVPTGSPSKLTLLPASSIAGLVVGPASVIYVEPPPADGGRGNDATAQRGNAALPCATFDKALALALAAMPSISTIEFAPGTYLPPSEPVNPGLTSCILQANGNPGDVIIDATGLALPCLDLSSAQPRQLWTVFVGTGVRMRADAGVAAVRANGASAVAGTYFTNGALSVGAVLEADGGFEFRCVGTLIMSNVEQFGNGAITIDRCGQVFFVGTGLFLGVPTCDINVDHADPKQPAGGVVQFLGQMVWPQGQITMSGQAQIRANAGNVLPAIRGSALTVGPGPGFAKPGLQIAQGCTLVGPVDFESAGREFPDDANPPSPTIILAGELVQHVGFKVAAPALTQIRVNCNGAIIRADVQAGDGVLATFRGAAFDSGPSNGGISTVGTGLCQPPDGAPIGDNAAAAITNTIPLPFAISGAYRVIPVADNAGTLPLAVNNYTTTTCDIVVTAAVGNLNGSIFMQ